MAVGYAQPNESRLLCHYPYLDGIIETSVIIVKDNNNHVIGTSSITKDGPYGLCVDSVFKDEVDKIRDECLYLNKNLGAVWRMITINNYRGYIQLILSLIHYTSIIAFDYYNLDIILYMIHPKHVAWYEKNLGFYILSGPRLDHSVNMQPAMLMRGDKDKVQYYLEQILRKPARVVYI